MACLAMWPRLGLPAKRVSVGMRTLSPLVEERRLMRWSIWPRGVRSTSRVVRQSRRLVVAALNRQPVKRLPWRRSRVMLFLPAPHDPYSLMKNAGESIGRISTDPGRRSRSCVSKAGPHKHVSTHTLEAALAKFKNGMSFVGRCVLCDGCGLLEC